MILADTSIWIEHFRAADAALGAHLEAGEIAIHPFVIGELALGGIRDDNRRGFYLRRLPSILIARHHEVMAMIDAHGLCGAGIGWVDTHLLCSTRVTPAARLWTHDRKLRGAAERLGVAR